MAEPVVQLTPSQYEKFWLLVAAGCGVAYFAVLGVELYVLVTRPILSALEALR